jgi:hypothetical protein
MNRSRIIRSLTAAISAVVLAGCGVTNPYQHPRTGTVYTTVNTTSHTTVNRPAPVAGGPRAVLRRFAQLSINWTSHTLANRQRQLAQLASGGARAQALQTAATYGAGSTLQRSGVANSGQITSIGPGQGPAAGQWVITTREKTTGRGDYTGLPSQRHVYQALVAYTRDGWKVSTWSPQN